MIKATVIIVPYAYCSYVNPKVKLLKIILPLYNMLWFASKTSQPPYQ